MVRVLIFENRKVGILQKWQIKYNFTSFGLLSFLRTRGSPFIFISFGCPFYMFLVHVNRGKKCPCGQPLYLVSTLFFLPTSIARSIQARHDNKSKICWNRGKKKGSTAAQVLPFASPVLHADLWFGYHPNSSLSLLVPIKSWFDQHVFIWGCEL